MEIKHKAIKSALFELVGAYVIDILLVDGLWPLRIEIYCSMEDSKQYQYRTWREEFFNLKARFPEEKLSLEHIDRKIIVGCGTFAPLDQEKFISADSADDALEIALNDLSASLKRITGESVQISKH